MEKELIDLIAEKNFDQLNSNDRAALGDWCDSEEEFQQMKDLFFGLEVLKKESRVEPKLETKKSLDDIFASVHEAPKTILWYNSLWLTVYPREKAFIRRPLIQVAAAIVLIVLISPLLFQSKLVTDKAQYAKNEIKKIDEPIIQEPVTDQSESKVQKQAESLHLENQVEVAFAEDLSTRSIDFIEDRRMVEMETFSAVAPSVAASGVTFDHPDGIFIADNSITYSQSAKDQPGLLDLLTATF